MTIRQRIWLQMRKKQAKFGQLEVKIGKILARLKLKQAQSMILFILVDLVV